MVRYPFGSLPCTLAKEAQLFPGLGLYSGIFAMYLQCQSNKSTGTGRATTIVFYAVCLLYFLSSLDFVSDFSALVLEVSNNSIWCMNTIFFKLVVQSRSTISILPVIFRFQIVQAVASGCCNFLAQCILVRINHCTYHPIIYFIHVNLRRFTVVGSCGVKISVW